MSASQIGLFIAVMLFTLILSWYWGKAVNRLKDSTAMNLLTRFLMRYMRRRFDSIKFYLLIGVYIGVGLVATFIIDVSLGFNIFSHVYLAWRVVPYIFIGFAAQVALSSLLLGLYSLFRPSINWYQVILSITWVRLMAKIPQRYRPLYPIAGATFEELFFRGTVFMVVRAQFPEIGLTMAILITTVLFIIQQVVNTETYHQAVAMASGAISISVVGCLLIAYTGSFIPALLCHVLFVVFYLNDSNSSRGSSTAVVRSVAGGY